MKNKTVDNSDLIHILTRRRDRLAHWDHPSTQAEHDLITAIEMAHHEGEGEEVMRTLRQALQAQLEEDAELYRTGKVQPITTTTAPTFAELRARMVERLRKEGHNTR